MASKPKVIVLVGLPGSGKSTYVQRRGLPALSSDEIRRLLADNPEDQTIHRRVFRVLLALLKHRLEIRRPVTCIDATNLTPWERRQWIEIARRHGARAEAIFFDVPPEVCQRRNQRRRRVVPAVAIERMARKLIVPTRAEGFAKVTVVR